MATPEEVCFFQDLYGCERKKEKLQTGSKSRIKTIISCSKQLSDNYHISLTSLLTEYPDNPSIRVHKSCVSRYTSTTNVRSHIAHLRKAENTCEENDLTPSKRKDYALMMHSISRNTVYFAHQLQNVCFQMNTIAELQRLTEKKHI